MSLIVALVAASLAQVRMPARIVGSLAPTNLLQSTDITFDTWIRVPSSDDYPGANSTLSGTGNIAGRIVAGHPHLFLWQFWPTPNAVCCQKVEEIDVDPSVLGSTSSSLASAPRAGIYSYWGDPVNGNMQSWEPFNNCSATQINGVGDGLGASLYYNDSNSRLYMTFTSSYTTNLTFTMVSASLDGPVSTNPAVKAATTFKGGPWRFTATQQQGSTQVFSTRSSQLNKHPTSGKMLQGGHGYPNTSKWWGPNLYGGADFPSDGTGGCGSSAINIPTHYLEYYQPGVVTGGYNAFTGAAIGTIAQFSWNPSVMSYAFQRGTDGGGERANPVTEHVATFSQSDSAPLIGWFEGTHKRGVIYALQLAANSTGQTDPSQCSTAALETYLSAGNGFIVYASHTGTFNGGDTLTGLTSGVTAQLVNLGYFATSNVLGVQYSVSGQNFTVGEIVTSSSGGSGTINEAHNNAVFDGGCSCPSNYSCATGPSFNWMTPGLAIYDPDDLALVASNSATDYLTVPDTFVNLAASPYSLTDVVGNLNTQQCGGGCQIAGGWLDTTNDKMYIAWVDNDKSRFGNYGETAIARFSINDSAPPPPLIAWLALPMAAFLWRKVG